MAEWHLNTDERGGYTLSYKLNMLDEAQKMGNTPAEWTSVRTLLNWVFRMKLPNDTVYLDGVLQTEPPNN